MKRVFLVVFVALLSARAAEAGQSYDRLINTLETDAAYKVRMFAVRVMSRRLQKSSTRAPDRVVAALGRAAKTDDAYLVRGLAVVALGKLADARARPHLEAAKRDSESFVRKQAERALETTPSSAPPVRSGKKRSLVVQAVDVPGVATPPEMKSTMLEYLSSGLRAKVGDSYRIDRGGDGKGFSLRGSIAESSVRPEGAEQRITVVVKLTIATWPENNLRQVLSAKASAKTKTKATASITRLKKKLLKAAVDRIVKDSMAQIGGG